MSGELAASTRVDQVVLTQVPTSDPAYESAFPDAVKAAMATCATGAKPLRLELMLTPPSGGKLSGGARFVDPATGAEAGSYAVSATGADAAAAGRALGQDLCRRAYPAPGPKTR